MEHSFKSYFLWWGICKTHPKELDYKSRYNVISKEDNRKALSRNSILYDGTSASKDRSRNRPSCLTATRQKNLYPLQPWNYPLSDKNLPKILISVEQILNQSLELSVISSQNNILLDLYSLQKGRGSPSSCFSCEGWCKRVSWIEHWWNIDPSWR